LDKVSYIIPVCNEEDYITGCLESIFASTYRNIEVIVIDDGSEDGTREILIPYLEKITYIYQEKSGIAKARNRGIEEAQGAMVSFMDADDIAGKMRVELEVKKMLDNPKLGMVFCGCTYIDENDGFLHGIGKVTNFEAEKFLGTMYEGNRLLSISTTLIKRDVLDNVGYFDEDLTFLEDYDLFLRIMRKYPVDYIDLPITRIRKHPGNYSKNIKNTDELERYILSKHDMKEIASSLARNYQTEEKFRVAFARVLFKAGRNLEAVKNLLKAIKLNRENFEAHFLLGNFYFYGNETDKALAAYRKCLVINPDHAECRNNLGVILYYKGDIINSRKEFELAKTIKRNFFDAEFNLKCIRKNSGLHKLKAHLSF